MITTKATIMGRDIEVTIEEADELNFAGAVTYVNEMGQEIRSNNGVHDTQKIVSIVAVQIAAELLKIKGLQESISDKYEKKIGEAIKLLERAEYSD